MGHSPGGHSTGLGWAFCGGLAIAPCPLPFLAQWEGQGALPAPAITQSLPYAPGTYVRVIYPPYLRGGGCLPGCELRDVCVLAMLMC